MWTIKFIVEYMYYSSPTSAVLTYSGTQGKMPQLPPPIGGPVSS